MPDTPRGSEAETYICKPPVSLPHVVLFSTSDASALGCSAEQVSVLRGIASHSRIGVAGLSSCCYIIAILERSQP